MAVCAYTVLILGTWRVDAVVKPFKLLRLRLLRLRHLRRLRSEICERCPDEVRRGGLRAALSDLPGARLGRRLARYISRILGGRRLLPRVARRRPHQAVRDP